MTEFTRLCACFRAARVCLLTQPSLCWNTCKQGNVTSRILQVTHHSFVFNACTAAIKLLEAAHLEARSLSTCAHHCPGSMSQQSFSIGLVLDAYFKSAFATQAQAAKAATDMRYDNLSCQERISELGKTFWLKDRSTACLDLADAIDAIHSRFLGYASNGSSSDRANEGTALAGQSTLCSKFVFLLDIQHVILYSTVACA